MVTYPFHPCAGQTVLAVGEIEHASVQHLIIRRLDGRSFHLPIWMTSPEAETTRIIACARLPVNLVHELRALVDGLVASSPREQVPEDTAMTRLNLAEPDLFEAPPRPLEMPDTQRAMALELIATVLTEAILRPAVASANGIAKEADHDEDHA